MRAIKKPASETGMGVVGEGRGSGGESVSVRTAEQQRTKMLSDVKLCMCVQRCEHVCVYMYTSQTYSCRSWGLVAWQMEHARAAQSCRANLQLFCCMSSSRLQDRARAQLSDGGTA